MDNNQYKLYIYTDYLGFGSCAALTHPTNCDRILIEVK